MNDDTPVVDNAVSQVQGVYCCEDLSQICNQSDVTAESCLDRFGESPAVWCSNSSAAVNADYQCVITADCIIKGTGTETQSNNVVVKYGDVDKLCNNWGHLEVGGC